MRLPLFALALAFGLPGTTAFSADLPPAPILDDETETLGSGWYLRADVGALDSSMARGSGQSSMGLAGIGIDRAALVGAGIGYRFSPWFRTDLTADHRFDATFKAARLPGGGAWARERGDFNATTLLVNGYLDLPLWDGITPYLGAGIGVTQARFQDAERAVVQASGAVTTLGLPSGDETVMAWALMGGVAFDITTTLTIDLGYRYSRIGQGGFDGDVMPVRPRHIAAHEFRIGARYQFD